jgi:hypothetical protein
MSQTTMSQTTLTQKSKLEQMKARLIAEEVKFKIKEQKRLTKHMIDLGKLIIKAELDTIPQATLCGGLLSLKDLLNKEEGQSLLKQWERIGLTFLEKDKKASTGVIITFESEPPQEIKTHLRESGLKWNKIRKEWYGHAGDLDLLKKGIGTLEHSVTLIS